MKKILLFVFFAALLLCFFCSQQKKQGSSVEVIEGIEYVHNPGTPLYPNRIVSFEEELTIQNEDEQGNVLLFRPRWYQVDRNGFIYISDHMDLQIKVFDPDGHLSRTVGQKGDGPGEFRSIGRIGLLPDDRLLVLDWEAHRISLFDTEGEFINSHKYKNWSYNFFLITSSFYVRDENIFSEKTELAVKAFDYSGKEIFSFGEFEPDHSQDINEAGRRFSVSLPYDICSLFAGDQKNTHLYHCMNDKYQIEAYDQTGKVFRKIDRPYKPLPTKPEDKKLYLEGFRNISKSDLALIDKNVKMPPHKTVTDRMFADDMGNLWVETNEEKEEQGKSLAAYDIFDEKGVYTAKVWLTVSPGIIKGGKMYTRETDEETGYREYKRYRIIWHDLR